MQAKAIAWSALVAFIIIALLPVGSMVVSSFTEEGGGFTLASYGKAFTGLREAELFLRSVLIAACAMLIALVIGVPLAFVIEKTDLPGRPLFRYIYLLPLLIPSYIHAIVWVHLLGENGVLNRLLKTLLQIDRPLFTIYGEGGAVFVLVMAYFPFVTLMCQCGMNRMDPGLEEAARLSHGWRNTLQKVSIPIIAPYILAGALFVFIFAISDYGVPDLLRVKTYPVEIFVQFSAFFDQGAASAIAMPLVLLTLLMVLYQKKIMGERSYVTLNTAGWNSGCVRLRRGRYPVLVFVTGIMATAVAAPLADLVAEAGSPSAVFSVIQSSWKDIMFTAGIAAAASLIMVSLSFILSYYIERGSGKWRRFTDFLTVVPFAIPATVYGIGFITVWNRQWLQAVYGTSLILLFACSARFIPFTTRVAVASMKQVHPSMIEAARLCSGNLAKTVGGITGPLCVPGIAASLYLGYVLCLGELGTTLLVIPPGASTITIRIYTLLHYGAGREVAALCLVLIGLAFLPFPFIALWIKKYAAAEQRY